MFRSTLKSFWGFFGIIFGLLSLGCTIHGAQELTLKNSVTINTVSYTASRGLQVPSHATFLITDPDGVPKWEFHRDSVIAVDVIGDAQVSFSWTRVHRW